jgi:anti-sigma B factor antagonist
VRQAGRLTLQPAGELDSATCARLTGALEDAIRDRDLDELALDRAAVTFIDSAGLRSLILIQQWAEREAVALAVVPPPAPLLELLGATGLDRRLHLVGGRRMGRME